MWYLVHTLGEDIYQNMANFSYHSYTFDHFPMDIKMFLYLTPHFIIAMKKSKNSEGDFGSGVPPAVLDCKSRANQLHIRYLNGASEIAGMKTGQKLSV